MPFKLIVQNSKIVLKSVANYILNVSGIKDLYTASSDVDSNGKIDWSLQHYSDTAASFTSNNPILLVGQYGVETDDLLTTPKFKIGDGVTAWNSLPYAISGGGGSQDLQSVTDNGATTTNLIEVGGLDNTAKLITLNKGGASSTGSGIQIEESGSILGYIKTAVGSAFDFLHPLNVNYARIALNLLTGNRTYNLPDNSGTIALTSDIPSLTGYEQTANKSSSYTLSSTTTYANTKALVDGLATKQNAVTWNDISSTSTVTGWSSFTIKEIFELVENNKVTVFFFIQGTSNSATTEFTVTNAANASIDAFYGSGLGVNSGAGLTNACRVVINASTSTVYFTTNWTGTSFAATGTKSVRGTLIYYK